MKYNLKLIFFICILFLTSCSIKNVEEATEISKLYNNGGIYGFDNNNRKQSIDNAGKFTDGANNNFDAYVNNDNFIVYYDSTVADSKIYADSVINALSERYDSLLEIFKFRTSIPVIQVMLYSDYKIYRKALLADFDLDIEMRESGPSPAFTVNANLIYITYKPEIGKFYIELPVHEFIHCLTMLISNEKEMPQWLFEGTAMYLSQETDRYRDSYNKVINKPIRNLKKASEVGGRQGYLYGFSMVEYVVENYGEESMYNLIKSYGDIEAVLNMSESEFIDNWISFLRDKVK